MWPTVVLEEKAALPADFPVFSFLSLLETRKCCQVFPVFGKTE